MPSSKTIWRLISSLAGGALRAIGKVQTFLILTLIYFAFIGPIALLARLFGSDFLQRRIGDKPTFWSQKPDVPSSLEESQNPF